MPPRRRCQTHRCMSSALVNAAVARYCALSLSLSRHAPRFGVLPVKRGELGGARHESEATCCCSSAADRFSLLLKSDASA